MCVGVGVRTSELRMYKDEEAKARTCQLAQEVQVLKRMSQQCVCVCVCVCARVCVCVRTKLNELLLL